MNFRGKQYELIFWDWLWTLAYYHGGDQKLYDWVIPFLKSHQESKHILISWAAKPEERLKVIRESGLMEYLDDAWTGKDATKGFESGKEVKGKAFSSYIEKLGIDKDKVLVVGDSFEHEIPAAQELGLDWVHISDFIKENGLIPSE